MKALVVDDSLTMRRIHQKSLETMGFAVTLAEDGLIAKNALSNGAFDLIVTDLHMPNMDGLALISAIRKDLGLMDLKILMVTSDGVLDIIQNAIGLGANDVLIKPFSAAIFSDRVRGLVDAN